MLQTVLVSISVIAIVIAMEILVSAVNRCYRESIIEQNRKLLEQEHQKFIYQLRCMITENPKNKEKIEKRHMTHKKGRVYVFAAKDADENVDMSL